MLGFLRGKVSDRKLRLFGWACCRRIWHLLTDERSRRHIEAGEHYADALISRELLRQEEQAGRRAWMDLRKRRAECEATTGPDTEASRAANQACWAAVVAIGPPKGKEYNPNDVPAIASIAAQAVDLSKGRLFALERILQCQYIRDIFGTSFRPLPPVLPAVLAWNDRTIPHLAEAVYEDRQMPAGTLDPARLGILADALLDAGCDDEGLLAHLRSPGPHVRGCWAVDLILGKS
jgi:hypothetical protein